MGDGGRYDDPRLLNRDVRRLRARSAVHLCEKLASVLDEVRRSSREDRLPDGGAAFMKFREGERDAGRDTPASMERARKAEDRDMRKLESAFAGVYGRSILVHLGT